MNYTIDSLINSCKNKNYFDLLKHLESEYTSTKAVLLNLKNHRNISEYQLREYQNYAKGLLFFLNTGAIPINISKNNFKVFKPIIDQLVADGMSASALDTFE